MISLSTIAASFSDEDYYGRVDIGETLVNALDSVDESYRLLIAAPSVFDPAKRKQLPVIAAWKINSRDNHLFHPMSAGQVVLSSIETGRIFCVPLVDYSHKMPAYNNESVESAPPAVENTGDITYSYNYHVRSLKDFPAEEGTVAVAVLCGNMLSNVRHLSVVASKQPASAAQAATTVSPAENPRYYFVQSPQSPAVPTSDGVVFSTEKNRVEPGRPYMLYGSFRFTSKEQHPGDIRLHLLLVKTGTSGDPFHIEVIVPNEFIRRNGTDATGHFMVDLMKVFFYQPDVRFDIPVETYVTAIRGCIFSGPFKIVLTGTPR